MNTFIPSKIFLTKGVGRHQEQLVSFEMSLRSAGIHFLNYVQVSSIFPPEAKLISRDEGLKLIKPGQVTHIVMSRNSTNENRRLLGASIGIAIPSDKEMFGYLSEAHDFGKSDDELADYVEDLSITMISTILGLPIDTNISYDEQLEQWKVSDKIIKSKSITQTAICGKNEWTTTIAAAVLI